MLRNYLFSEFALRCLPVALQQRLHPSSRFPQTLLLSTKLHSFPLPLFLLGPERINLPRGGDTHITIDEYKLLLDSVVEGGEASRARKLFDESRVSNRWTGQKEANNRELNQEDIAREIQKNNAGFGWRDGPPILGDGEGELPLEQAHIGGRIFGEEIFASAMAAQGADGEDEDEDEDDGFFFDSDG